MAQSGIRFTDTEGWSLDQREGPEARNREADSELLGRKVFTHMGLKLPALQGMEHP